MNRSTGSCIRMGRSAGFSIARTISVDAAGKSRRITGVVIDITERKKADEALRESEERYRNVVETQSELICRYLPDTHPDICQRRLLPVLRPFARGIDRQEVHRI